MADRIVVMNTGVVEQIGTPAQLYDQPANLFVAGFIGSPSMNLLQGTFVAEEGVLHVDHKGFRLPCIAPGAARVDMEVIYGVRPEHVHVAVDSNPDLRNATVEVVELTGPDRIVVLDFAGNTVVAAVDKKTPVTTGQEVEITFQTDETHLFDGRTGKNLKS